MKDRFSLGVALGVALTVVVGGSLAYGPELLDLPVAQAKKRQKKAAPSSAKTRLPNGRSLMPIKNGVYPRDYFPNTEKLGPNEMRIVALGTGMPQVIQKKTKASGWYVELGNGEKFLFDLGTGSMESDHAGDFAPLYIGGWMNGRYTPLHIYGPTGSRPELGTKAFVENQVKAWAWDIEGRKGSFPDAGGRALVKEFDYKKVQQRFTRSTAR
jgi:ribonuclease Z